MIVFFVLMEYSVAEIFRGSGLWMVIIYYGALSGVGFPPHAHKGRVGALKSS